MGLLVPGVALVSSMDWTLTRDCGSESKRKAFIVARDNLRTRDGRGPPGCLLWCRPLAAEIVSSR